MGSGRTTILIVEDSPLGLKLAEVLFATEGFEVRSAASATEGLVVLRHFRPDVVLTDIRLPDMDGLEFTRRIKADPATRHLLVLATSAELGVDESRIRAAGCDAFIPKPIEVALVRARLTAGDGGGNRSIAPRAIAPRAETGADGDVLDGLRRATAKLGLAASDPWLAEVLEECTRDLRELRRAAARPDAQQVRKIAHRMAGPSGMIGAARVVAVCLELEALSATGALDPSTPLLDRLEQELAATGAALQGLARDD
jgi:CheY-like chemotaxis protein